MEVISNPVLNGWFTNRQLSSCIDAEACYPIPIETQTGVSDMTEVSFKTTIKGGLPVMVDAEYEGGVWYATDVRWLGRRGTPGKSVPASIFETLTNNRRELDRLNSEAAECFAGYCG